MVRLRQIADLANHDCVLFRARAGKLTWVLTDPDGVEESVEINGPVETDDIAYVQRLLIAGVGIGLIPTFLCPQAVERNELVPILPHYLARDAPLHVVVPSSQHEPARVTLFRDFLVENLTALSWG